MKSIIKELLYLFLILIVQMFVFMYFIRTYTDFYAV